MLVPESGPLLVLFSGARMPVCAGVSKAGANKPVSPTSPRRGSIM